MPSAHDLEPLFRIHADLCKALASPHRLAMLHSLCQGEMCVSEVATALGMSVQNVSQHLRVLKERKLVRSRKEGQTVYYSITNSKFIEACSLIRQALIEQHQAEGEFVLAAELMNAVQQLPLPQPVK
jgi:DNA-binding transcriptional ArsR family regulator